MIRPFTFVTLMLACTSGAYLFVVKHRAASLDTQISSVTGQIRSAEQRIRVLQAEWALENDPSQLAALSKRFLKLKPMEPGQMTTLSRLAELLPPPGAGLPHLPLPPPPSWAATPDGDNPGDQGVAGPVAIAVPALRAPVMAATALPPPVRLAAAQTKSFVVSPVAVRHAAAKTKRSMPPVQHPVHDTAPHFARPVTVATAHAAMRMTPRLAAARTYNDPPYRAAAARQFTETQSVFGNLGADLPPPRPVLRSSQ